MDPEGNFMSIVDRLPYDKDKIVGQAVGFFLKNQSPDEIDFTKYENGYQIQVYCNGENAAEAKEFWQENVDPHLGGEQ